MEKITIRLNKANHRSSDCIRSRDIGDDIAFLRDCFNISYKRADNLLREMSCDRTCASTDEAIIDVTYEQLARYVAKRQVEGLNKYWKYPHVLKFVEDDCEVNEEQPIEIRPDRRSRYC